MGKNFYKIITIILSIIFIVLAVTLITMKVVNGKEREDKELLLLKITDEMSFIDYNVIDAMNKLNNITVTRYKIYTKTVNNSEDNSKNIENSSNKGISDQGGNAGDSTGGDEQSQESNSEEGASTDSKDKSSGGSNSSESSNAKSNSEKEVEMALVNSLTETDNQEPDWNSITSIYENLVSIWPTTQLDLKRAGIGDEYLENINVHLNGIAQSILNKDKNSCLVNLYNLYSQIPTYMEIISTDNYMKNLYNTKMYILNAYALVNADNKWNEISSSIKSATAQFEKIVNSETKEKEKDNLEKIYSMLKNLESTVALNNKNIFYMQYKNVMQEISNL